MNRVVLDLKKGDNISVDEDNNLAKTLINKVAGIEQTASEEVNIVNAASSASNFLTDLEGVGARKAFDMYNSIISRTNEAELDALALPFHVLNINWEQFCSQQDLFNIINAEVPDGKISISENISYKDQSREFVANLNTLIPYIEDADLTKIYTRTTKQVNSRGMLVNQQKENIGIISYITFEQGKKIFGIYVVPEGSTVKQFYYVEYVKSEDVIPNISIPNSVALRSLSEDLTEGDIIEISNSSTRLKKKVGGFTSVEDAMVFFNGMLFNTVDYAYINKLLLLNKQISAVKL